MDISAYHGAGGYFPDDAQIRHAMEDLMKDVDLETMSTKQFIAALSARFGGVDLSPKKKFIKLSITEIIDSLQQNDDVSEEESSEEEAEVKPKRKGGGGLSAVKEISQELADFLGTGRQMARTDVVKAMWQYIKANDLQNPEDKRAILLDDKMKGLFGVDTFTMFTMNKYIGAHIEPYKPVDLTTNSTPKKRKAKRKSKDGKKRKSGGGLNAPFRVSDDLAAVTGERILSRPQVTKKLWEYIRENNLQNPENKREILCDEMFSRVMGGEAKVTMFTMNKYISPHMLEKMPVPKEESEEESHDQ